MSQLAQENMQGISQSIVLETEGTVGCIPWTTAGPVLFLPGCQAIAYYQSSALVSPVWFIETGEAVSAHLCYDTQDTGLSRSASLSSRPDHGLLGSRDWDDSYFYY